MFFSVVIPTCHRNDLLALCLERLAPGAQTLSAQEYEVIVSDDGMKSTAEDMIRARFPWARWCPGPRRGPAANRNQGAKIGQGEWLVFIDDDCLPSPGWLEAFEKMRRARPSARVLEGRTHADRPRQSMDEIAPLNETGGYLWSCNFAIAQELFRSLGGFDEDFPYAAMEDVDLRKRLLAGGDTIVFCPDAAVCHPWRKHAGSRAVTQAVESHLIFWRKYPDDFAAASPLRQFRVFARTLLKDTVPNAIRLRGRGLRGGLRQLFFSLRLAGLSFRLRWINFWRSPAGPKKTR